MYKTKFVYQADEEDTHKQRKRKWDKRKGERASSKGMLTATDKHTF